METELIKEINHVLKTFSQFWEGETLNRSMVVQAINKKEPELIRALIHNEKIKSIYSTVIDGVIIFDFDKLTSLLKYKEYWPDSFTKYRNSVGLTSDGKYLDRDTDVVLDFPFKDCVLEGGMTKEDQGKEEVYYNEIIARDEIDRLFSPKLFTNTKRYNSNGVEENITDFHDDDNLIIKGNNLLALHSLKERYAGKVKLIYIDPPYNTGNDSFKYNDRFNHSTWLVFMKNRLEIARELLSDDGVIFVHCDYNEDAYLKVLADFIFGIENYITTITVRSNSISGNKTQHKNKTILKNKDSILCYKKHTIKINPQYSLKKEWDTHYNSVLDKENNSYIAIGLKEKLVENSLLKTTDTISSYLINNKDFSKFVFNNRHKIFRLVNSIPENLKNLSLLEKDKIVFLKQANNEIYYALNGKRLSFLSNTYKKINGNEQMVQLLGDLWIDIDFQNTQNQGGINFTNAKKPEQLLKRIISLITDKNDLVLDFFLGSGTTAAVAHKMGRRYIGIEQMDYIEDITVARLQKVIEGEQGGISKDVNWQDGGSFVYAELMQLNQIFVSKIQEAQDTNALKALFKQMRAEAHLNYQVALDKVLNKEHEIEGVSHKVSFEELPLEKQKRLLIEILDKNQLYVNASEMDDETLHISEEDKAFTKSFYQKG